jgi:adenylate cyclase
VAEPDARWGSEEPDGIIGFLRSLGATQADIEGARRDCRLAGLAADLVLARGADLSAEDLAAHARVDTEAVVALWRTLGITVPRVDQPLFSRRDAEFTARAVHVTAFDEHGAEFLRVIGISLARIAEAAVSLYTQTVEPQLDTPEVDPAVWAKDLADKTTMALHIGDSMGAMLAHHMREAIDRQRAAQAGVAERSVFRLAVGFVDLVGFTPISLHSAPAELLDLVGRFEARAFDVAAAHNGRIIKHIGDEVMFVALDPGDGCAIAHDLMTGTPEDIAPCAGLAFGDVITRRGDYYGAVVNLASRLADLAVPREVLVDETTARRAAGRFSFRPAGRRLLKGFDEPVDAYSLGD